MKRFIFTDRSPDLNHFEEVAHTPAEAIRELVRKHGTQPYRIVSIQPASAFLVTKTDGTTALLWDYARAHGLAGHHGWTVRELSPIQAAAHIRATLAQVFGKPSLPATP